HAEPYQLRNRPPGGKPVDFVNGGQPSSAVLETPSIGGAPNMLSNPYTGSDLAEPWEQGFAAGFLAPDQDLTAPSPLTIDAQDAYNEGIIAGKLSIRGMRVPPVSPPERPGTWKSVVEFAVQRVTEHVLLY